MESPPHDQATQVLIVDDSSTVRRQVAAALSDTGYEVLQAADGQEGLDVILSTPGLAAVVCDLNMPRMNGLQLLSSLKDKGVSVPVIMLTTEGQPELIQQARSSGALGWMVKPFDPAILSKAVGRLVERQTAKSGDPS